jgi:hypothetical protein
MEREERMRNRIRTALIAAALGTLTLAAPSEAKKLPEASFKLLSVSGTQAHTFHEETWAVRNFDDDGNPLPGPTRVDTCTGNQSQSIRYRTTKPTKMYVFLRRAHGLHTLVSDKSDPDSGLDFLRAPGEMTLARSVSYEATQDCESPPVECPEATFPSPVLVFGNHEPSGGITPAYDTNLNLPSGLDRSCEPYPGAHIGPLSPFAMPPDRDLEEILGVIPRSEIFNEKRKRLSGKDSFEFPYETTSDPADTPGDFQTRVTGTYRETIAVELKRLKPKR